MAKNDPEQVVAGAGLLTAIFTKLNAAVTRKGGQPGALHRLSTPDGDVLIEQFADLIVGQNQNGTITGLLVNYDEFRTINKDRYYDFSDVSMNNVPEVESGTKLVLFRELEFDHATLDQEVLEKAGAENCRQPSRAEVETYIRHLSADQLGKKSYVGLIGPGVRRASGYLNRVVVVGHNDGVNLKWAFPEVHWHRDCRFVVVCKPACR